MIRVDNRLDPFASSLLGHACGELAGASGSRPGAGSAAETGAEPAGTAERAPLDRRGGPEPEVVIVAEAVLASPANPLHELPAWKVSDAPPPSSPARSLTWMLPVALAYPERLAVQEMAARVGALAGPDPVAETCCRVYCMWIREALRGRPLARAWQKAIEKVGIDSRRGPLAPGSSGPVASDDPLWAHLAGAAAQAAPPAPPRSGAAGALITAAHCCLATDTAGAAIARAVDLGAAGTAAALVGGAAGAFHGDPPADLVAGLAQRTHLEELASALRRLRHEQVYATVPKPFAFYAVDQRLWGGRNPLTELDVLRLEGLGIRRVLDLREKDEYGAANRHGQEAVAALARRGIERLHLPIVDGEAPAASDLDRACAFLGGAAGGDGAVPTLVHCRAGIERTGAVLLAFVASDRGISLDRAEAELAAQEVPIQPLEHQRQAVERWLARRRSG